MDVAVQLKKAHSDSVPMAIKTISWRVTTGFPGRCQVRRSVVRPQRSRAEKTAEINRPTRRSPHDPARSVKIDGCDVLVLILKRTEQVGR